MGVTRKMAGFAAVIAAVLGLSLATAGPAAASGSLSWRNFGNTDPINSSGLSSWACATSVTIATDVVAQVCGIVAPDGVSVQAAVIVRNNRSSVYSVQTTMNLTDASTDEQFWNEGCRPSGVGAHSWAVCFGFTEDWPFGPVFSHSFANDIFLGNSPNV